MRYNALIINLFSCVSSDGHSSTIECPQTPESPPRQTPEPASKYNASSLAQTAAHNIASLTRLHRREFGVSRAHQFAMYAINLALFTMLESDSFDVLDADFLSLASAFSIVASRSALGRNLFHIFRQSVRAKAQGAAGRGRSRFDEYAEGLEKLDLDEKYHGISGRVREGGNGSRSSLQDYPGLGLSEMLDRYESLSLGKDEVFSERKGGMGGV